MRKFLIAAILLVGCAFGQSAMAACGGGPNGTVQPQAYLLTNEFPNGQVSGSITPDCLRDLIASLGAKQYPSQRVGDFLNSFGVNSALYTYVTPDIDFLTIVNNLQYIGATTVRIQPNTVGGDPFLVQEMNFLANNGIKAVLSAPLQEDTPNLIVANLTAAYQGYTSQALNAIAAIEQPNEPPQTNYVYSGSTASPSAQPGFRPVANFMSAHYAAVRALAVLNNIPILTTTRGGEDFLDDGLPWLTVPNGYTHATLTSNAVTTASATLHFAATGTANLQNGLQVYLASNTTNQPLGTISSFTSTTIVLSTTTTQPGGTVYRIGAQVPDSTQFGDCYNIHFYPLVGANFGSGSQKSVASIDPSLTNGGDYLQQALKDYFSVPDGASNSHATGPSIASVNASCKWITEYGLDTGQTGAGNTEVDQATQAKNYLSTWLNAWNEGFQKFIMYTAFDLATPCSTNTSFSQCMGYYTFGEVAKTSATYQHNFITILADPNPVLRNTFATAPLAYTLGNMPSGGQSLLFQASNGTYFLVLWNNVADWNVSTGAAISVGATSVTVNFPSRTGTINIYDPTVGTTAQSTSTGSNVTVSLKDYPMIVSFQ